MSRFNLLYVVKAALFIVLWMFAGTGSRAACQDTVEIDRESQWKGFQQSHFKVAGQAAYIVSPKKTAIGKPWVWRARFPGYHAEMDVQLLGRGFHIAYVDVAGMFGCPQAIEIGDAFYGTLTTKFGLSKKVVLEGVSRGGLMVYNWAAKNPNKVACIYCDTPVCDILSWPGGKGAGRGSEPTWKQCLEMYKLSDEQSASFRGCPIDHAKVIADAKIPILHIVSENDQIVPPVENTYVLKNRLQKFGHEMKIISVPTGTEKSQGHHFEHPEPDRVVEFIVENAKPKTIGNLELLKNSKRILFLGDSITYSGQYVAGFEAWIEMQRFERPLFVINAGLPSETVSGLSENGHAGGRFPRPDLAERLDRVLTSTKPDLVFACYGINCGIYQPLDESRFKKFKLGIHALKKRVEENGATLILVTPPFFDDARAKKAFSYNEVLAQYAGWLVQQRQQGWSVIDLHTSMTEEVAEQRTSNSKFTFQPDSVHPNAQGHWFIASRLIAWFGGGDASESESPQAMLGSMNWPADKYPLVVQRMQLLRDSYLTESGHRRPGIKTGSSIEKALEKSEALTRRIRK